MSLVTLIESLCVELASYLDAREPWRETVVALRDARTFTPGDGRGPIALRLDALVGAPSTSSVLDAVRAAVPALRWQQNSNYDDADFLCRYAYCELLGPLGHARDARFSIGLLYLAPHTFYPAHAHPAEEAYHVLAGASEWWQGESAHTRSAADAFDARACTTPGARVLHESGIAHAMRSGATPLLALYLWRGAIATPATLLRRTG